MVVVGLGGRGGGLGGGGIVGQRGRGTDLEKDTDEATVTELGEFGLGEGKETNQGGAEEL